MAYRNPEDDRERRYERLPVPIPIPKPRQKKQETDIAGQLLGAGANLLGSLIQSGVSYGIESKLGEERAALVAKESKLQRTYLTGERVAGQTFTTSERVAAEKAKRLESWKERAHALNVEQKRIDAGLALEDLSQKNRIALEDLKERYRKEAARLRRIAASRSRRKGDWLLHEGKLYNRNELKSQRDFYMKSHEVIANTEYGKEGRQKAYNLQHILDVAQNLGGDKAVRKLNNGVSPAHNAVFGGAAPAPTQGGTPPSAEGGAGADSLTPAEIARIEREAGAGRFDELTPAEIARIEGEAGVGRSDELTPAEIARIEREAGAGLDSLLRVEGRPLPPSQSQVLALDAAGRAARGERRGLSEAEYAAKVAVLQAKLKAGIRTRDTEVKIMNAELRGPLKSKSSVKEARNIVSERLATARKNGPGFSIDELNRDLNAIAKEITELTGERVSTVSEERGAAPAPQRGGRVREPTKRDRAMINRSAAKAQDGTLTTEEWGTTKHVAEETGVVFDVEDPQQTKADVDAKAAKAAKAAKR